MKRVSVAIGCGMLVGVDAIPVTIEATGIHAGDGTPRILGLVDTGVREAWHRVLHAFQALGLPAPRGVSTVNFLPASVRKTGSGFDLPLALALATAGGLLPQERTKGLCAFGEVSLRGRLHPARGAVAVALCARARGWHTLLTSLEDAGRCSAVSGISVHGAATLADALHFLLGHLDLPVAEPAAPPPRVPVGSLELADIRGHRTPKLALATAAAGCHNLLLVGPPGSGKSALLRRLPALLPVPTVDEQLEILRVHTAATMGVPPPSQRPFRAPHHTSSTASLLGGGAEVRPGEATLAHRGVLFLDELPEFRRDALEALRQPLEEGEITVGRAQRTVRMPADFILVAAMNPCPCGYRGHPQRPCLCPPPQVGRYRARISGPLLDRLDLQVEVPSLDPAVFHAPVDPDGTTAALRARVDVAVGRQAARNRRGTGWIANGRLQDGQLEHCVAPSRAVLRTLEEVLRRDRQSGRARVRLLRIARTLADLEDRDDVEPRDVLEASALRGYADLTVS